MVGVLHQLTAGLYLSASLLAFFGLTLPGRRSERLLVPLLVVGLVAHAGAFAALHTVDPPPPLTVLPAALSWTAWVAILFCLLLLGRGRLLGLVGLVTPLAFAAVFVAGLVLPGEVAAPAPGGSWPHLHVILASAGLGLLGVAGLAGGLFLVAERRLKRKRPARNWQLPSLEALDRVNGIALGLGFPLLTCGVIAGLFWSRGVVGSLWGGGPHQTWTALAWGVYVALALARFSAGWRGREAALASAGGFAFLLFALLGVEWIG